MSKNHIKSAVVWGISKGLNLPQIPIDRINELCFLRDLLLELKIDLVLDVGANRGQFASELRGIGYKKSIVSFEPVVSEYLALKESFVGDRHWRGYQYALGSQEKLDVHNCPETDSSQFPVGVQVSGGGVNTANRSSQET